MSAAAERVIARCREIAAHTEVPGETSRPFLCKSARAVHVLVGEWMAAAGMQVRLDDAGNLRGVSAGVGAATRRLLLGSHLDTVPNAGAFDGILGVVAAIAVVEEMRGQQLPFAIEVIGFSEEEGVRFSRPFLGSLALCGRLDAEALALEDRQDVSVRSALCAFGLDPEKIADAEVVTTDAIGFLEVHIEQGPVLEAEGLSLGVVEAIVGQTRLLLRFCGVSNHAGTTPMDARRDPVTAAAEWIVAVEKQTQATDGLVATVGRLEARPGVANVIAGEVMASLDVRHASDEVRLEAVRDSIDLAEAAADRRGVRVVVETTMEQAAVPMSRDLVDVLERAAERAGHAARRMVSGAGHDAMILAERMPSAMLFVRSPGGVSHSPGERVLTGDVGAAIDTMLACITMLAASEGGGEHA